jgi:hypothetical protein
VDPLLDTMLRVAGALVATLAAVVVAVTAAFLTMLRIGTVEVPFGIAVVVVGNVLVIGFAKRATGSVLGLAGPCLAWFVTTLVMTFRTTEGDLVLPGDWRSIAVMLAGAVSIAAAAFLAAMPSGPRQRVVPPG